MSSLDSSVESQRPPPQQGGGLDLLPDEDDDPGFRDDDDDEDDEVEEEAPRRRSRGSRSDAHMVDNVRGRAKRRASSRMGKTSGRRRQPSGGGRRSGTGRRSSGGAPVSRDCPVCDEEIAAIAESCPHCGARLRAPSAMSELPKQLAQMAGPLLALALFGGGGYFLYSHFTAPKGNTIAVKTRKGRKTPKRDPSPEPSAEASPSATPTPSAAPSATPTDEQPEETPEVSRAPDRPPAVPSETVRGNVVPKGPHSEAFQRLLDARGASEGREAVAALAKVDAKTLQPLLEAASLSDDKTYRMRLHRVGLRLGTPEEQLERLKTGLADHSGAKLCWTVLVALETDPQGLRGPLQSIGYDEVKAAGRALADLGLGGQSVSSNVLASIRATYEGNGEELEEIVAPALALAGGVEVLDVVARSLDHPSEVIQKIARVALERVSAGQGPGASASSAAWAEWVAKYQPIRKLLAVATRDLGRESLGAAERSRALMELIKKGKPALEALPIFLREQASRTPPAGKAVGALIAALASSSDRELLASILLAVENHDEAATPVVCAVMLVADSALAEEAAKAVIAIGIPPRRWSEIPPLKRAPSEASVAAMVEWAEGRMDKERSDGYLLAAAFRSSKMAKNLIEGRGVKRLKVSEIAARLGSEEIDESLLKVIRGERERTLDVSSVQDAGRRLMEAGTEAGALSGLIDIIEERKVQNYHVAKALSAVAPPKAARKIKKELEDWQNSRMEIEVQRAYGEIGGEKAVDDLAKLYKGMEEGDRRGLERILMELGSKAARDIALKPFRQLQERGWKEGVSFGEIVFLSLVRCGKREDGALLVEYLKEGRPSRLNMTRCLMGIGLLGYKPGLSQVTAFIHQNQNDRAKAAASAALLGGGSEDMLAMVQSGDVLERHNGDDLDVLAALSVVDPEAAGPVAKPFVPKLLAQSGDYRAVSALAFALTHAGDDESLLSLCDMADPKARAAIGRGIAWAAISGKERPAYPSALDLLAADPEAIVRAEAMIGRAYLDKKEAADEIARVIGFLTEEELSVDRMGDSGLVPLCNGFSIRALRPNLWHAHKLAGGRTPPFREQLGLGRIWEVEREMR